MARTAVIISVLAIILIAGCQQGDQGRAQLQSAAREPVRQPVVRSAAIVPPTAGEIDLVEEVALNRRAYRETLAKLVNYYENTGNHLKLQWARTEYSDLERMAQYDYIIEAAVAGPSLRASTAIEEADELFREAFEMDRHARHMQLVPDNDQLRIVLDKLNQLINRYPSSDKLDDAAYLAGDIYEHFKDYSIAVLYFTRTFEWNPDTPYPAKYRAAKLLDTKLSQRQQALDLYRQALAGDKINISQRRYANRRVETLSTSD